MSVCLRCGYDLRATPVEMPCPECGLAAHRSVIEHVHPDDCPPAWVASIAVGAKLLLFAYCGAGSLLLFATLIMDRVWSDSYSEQIYPFVAVGSLAFLVAHAVGCYLVTLREKGRKPRKIEAINARVLRIAMAPPAIAGGLLSLIAWLPLQAWPQLVTVIDVNMIIGLLMVPLMVCPALTFFRLRVLALRLSRPRLAEHVTIVAVGSASSLLLQVMLASLGGPLWGDSEFRFFITRVIPWALIWLFDLWALLLLFVVVRKFTQSAREARARWKAADASRGNA